MSQEAYFGMVKLGFTSVVSCALDTLGPGLIHMDVAPSLSTAVLVHHLEARFTSLRNMNF